MSSLIVLSLRVFGMPDGAGEVLVMAVALGLILAVAVALWRPTRRRHAVGSVDAEPRGGGRGLAAAGGRGVGGGGGGGGWGGGAGPPGGGGPPAPRRKAPRGPGPRVFPLF